MFVLVLFVFLLVFFIFMCSADEKKKMPEKTAVPSKTLADNVFKKGETIIFGVYSKGIKVGSGKMVYHGIKNVGGQDLQHITFNISTFSVKDEEDVFGSLDFSSPVVIYRDVHLFGRHEIIQEEYATDARSLKILKSINNKPVPEVVVHSKEPMTNVLLLIYSLRNEKTLKTGASFKIVLPTQAFELKVQSSRKIKVPKGSFDAAYLESYPSKYKVWLDSGKEKLPVRIQGLAAGGMMYLALVDVY